VNPGEKEFERKCIGVTTYIKVSKRLSDREKFILTERLASKTLKEIAYQLNLATPERVRQIEHKALVRLTRLVVLRSGIIKEIGHLP